MANELTIVDSYCTLNKTSLIFKRDITKDEWFHVFQSLKMIEGCIQFWIGDCLAYRQQKWGMYDDIAEETGYDKKQLWDYKKIAESVKSSERSEDLGYSHHREVASLSPEKQTMFLDMAVKKSLSVRELREEIKKDLKAEIVNKAGILPSEKCSVIYVDPPWPVGSIVLDKWESPLDDKYFTMSIEEIKNMSISEMSADDCSLFIWTTHTFLPDCLDIIKEWGFKYHCLITWNKGSGWTQFGFHKMTEFLLFAYKGNIGINQYGKAIPTLISENKTYHSKKPDSIRDLIKSKTTGIRAELFSRGEPSEGWIFWGNEVLGSIYNGK